MRNTVSILIFIAGLLVAASCSSNKVYEYALAPDEYVWGGKIADGAFAPYAEGFASDLKINTGNQVCPLLLTSKGTYIWSDDAFAFRIDGGKIIIDADPDKIETVAAGSSLRDAFVAASKAHFPANGMLPPAEFYEKPQYNTWIELTYNQNQADVLKYAHGILENGLPAGIIMIDDTWQDDYGKWVFDPAKFPDPRKMVDELHSLGFKVMLWVCPFVSMDQYRICSEIESFDGFLRTADGSVPYPVRWWNGTSAVLDLSNEKSKAWFNAQLHNLMDTYGIDGFKFDAGDSEYYPSDALCFDGSLTAEEHCSLFVQLAEGYEYNELRAGWMNGGKAIVQRLHDKDHSWEDLRKLVPEMIAESLCGFSFCCPDMVGGGNFMAFNNPDRLDQDLIVRSAQCHALMPMVQFSLAPWRVLDKEHYQAVLDAMATRQAHIGHIKSLFENSAITGEPVLAPIEYYYPNCGMAGITDEFLLGPDMLVAPMLAEGSSRTVTLPEGEWVSDLGDIFAGNQTIVEDVPIDRIPYYTKTK